MILKRIKKAPRLKSFNAKMSNIYIKYEPTADDGEKQYYSPSF